jgi:hypothetical protein
MEPVATTTPTSADESVVRPPPALDLEATPVTGQLACAVLDAATGAMVRGDDDSGTSSRSSSSSRNSKQTTISEHNASILYQMLLETGQLKKELPIVKRMTVTYNSHSRYIVTRDEHHVYIVQVRV